MLTKQVQAIELNIADAHALEENLNLQIEAAVALVLSMVSMLNQSLLITTGR
jgi:hypothetical protein